MNDGFMFFKFVKTENVLRYLAAGWVVCQINKPTHHEAHGFIMEWDQLGEPPDMDERRASPDVASAGDDRAGDNRG